MTQAELEPQPVRCIDLSPEQVVLVDRASRGKPGEQGHRQAQTENLLESVRRPAQVAVFQKVRNPIPSRHADKAATWRDSFVNTL